MSQPELNIKLNKKAPNFKLSATGDQTLSLADFKGKNLVIYFYPKDNTPGCTTEGQNFRDLYEQFQALNTEILGVSRDSVKVHTNFKAKHQFPFELLSDGDEKMCTAYDVIKLKKLYGREYMGIERSTFLIDEQGKLRNEWRKVKVKGHADEVLEAVKNL
ncbi:MAG: peroxiredoxin [Kangiellaceae bacterium]|nr:peroxiredoxin [Kangiellaceae bacterium]